MKDIEALSYSVIPAMRFWILIHGIYAIHQLLNIHHTLSADLVKGICNEVALHILQDYLRC